MKILNITDASINQKELEILVEKEKFVDAMAYSVKKNSPKANVPGFRKGHAPKSIIEKYYGVGFFYEDAFNQCIPQAYEEALDETKLDVVSSPVYDIKTVKEGEDLVFTAKVYVKPACEMDEYKGIEVETTEVVVTDEAVNNELETVRKQNAREIEVTDRPAQKDDTANINYSGSCDGVKFDGGTAENYDLKLGSNTFIPGFEDQIIGHSVGEEFDVNVTFPEEYQEATLAGKAAVFACKLNALKYDELPDLDDEFAKDVSECDTLDEYKAQLKEKLTSDAQARKKDEIMRTLSNKVSALLKADIPQVMYDNELEQVVRDYENRLQYQGISLDMFFKYTNQTMDDLKKQMTPQAQNNVKVRLALETIAKLENIDATDDEVNTEYENIAKQYSIEVDRVKSLVSENDIKGDIKVRKALDFVYDNAKITYKEETKEEEKVEETTEEKAE